MNHVLGTIGCRRCETWSGLDRLAGDIDQAARTAGITQVIGPFDDFNRLNLSKIKVKSRRIHARRATAVDPYAVHQDIDIISLQATQHYIVGNWPFA